MLQFDIRVTVRTLKNEVDFPLTIKQKNDIAKALVSSISFLAVDDHDDTRGNFIKDYKLTIANIKEVK